MTETRDVVFWHHDDSAERLCFESVDEAIEDYIEQQAEAEETIAQTVTVYGFARMKPSPRADWLLETIIENLDEVYGDPEGELEVEITDQMWAAAEEFAQKIAQEYGKQCWACEQVTSQDIDMRAWLALHHTKALEAIAADEESAPNGVTNGKVESSRGKAEES